jgi:hypothetical protein
MKVYISKYALTKGIFELEVEDCGDGTVKHKNSGYCNDYYHEEGKDYFLTKEDAIKKANELKEKKIQSIEKQLKKLKEIKFE